MKYAHLTKELGEEQVRLLQEKTVSVIGLGGIGSTVVDLLVRSGINVRIIEKGRVEEADMDRLSLFGQDDVAKFKATQAKKKLAKINPDVKIKSFNEEISKESLFLVDADVVLDCSGDPEMTEQLSLYCKKQKLPLVFAEVRNGRAVVAHSNEKQTVWDQIKSLKDEKGEGLFPASTHMAAGFMFTKAVKLLLGDKPKRGVVIYNVLEQAFEDKRGNKK